MKEYKFKINGKEYNVAIGEASGKMLSVNVNGADYQVELENAPAAAPKPVQQAPKADNSAFKALSKEQRKQKNRVDFLEKEIARDEKRMKEIEAVLAAPGPQDDIMELTREYLELKRSLDSATEEWTELMIQLEN